MLKLKEMRDIGRSMLTLKRLLLAGAAAAGLYTVGDEGISYLTTATRLATEGLNDQIPVEFELERAKTMIDSLVPDIKRNMIVIAKEEVGIDAIREEVASSEESFEKQREELIKLREEAQRGSGYLRIGGRPATDQEIKDELMRRLARLKLFEATLGAKQDLLTNRESSLAAARNKLERMVSAKRDLEAQVDNLQARLRTVQSEATASSVEFDDTEVAKCQKLVDELRARLLVAERLITTNGDFENIATSISVGDQDVLAQIDEYLAKNSTESTSTKGS